MECKSKCKASVKAESKIKLESPDMKHYHQLIQVSLPLTFKTCLDNYFPYTRRRPCVTWNVNCGLCRSLEARQFGTTSGHSSRRGSPTTSCSFAITRLGDTSLLVSSSDSQISSTSGSIFINKPFSMKYHIKSNSAKIPTNTMTALLLLGWEAPGRGKCSLHQSCCQCRGGKVKREI